MSDLRCLNSGSGFCRGSYLFLLFVLPFFFFTHILSLTHQQKPGSSKFDDYTILLSIFAVLHI